MVPEGQTSGKKDHGRGIFSPVFPPFKFNWFLNSKPSILKKDRHERVYYPFCSFSWERHIPVSKTCDLGIFVLFIHVFSLAPPYTCRLYAHAVSLTGHVGITTIRFGRPLHSLPSLVRPFCRLSLYFAHHKEKSIHVSASPVYDSF